MKLRKRTSTINLAAEWYRWNLRSVLSSLTHPLSTLVFIPSTILATFYDIGSNAYTGFPLLSAYMDMYPTLTHTPTKASLASMLPIKRCTSLTPD